MNWKSSAVMLLGKAAQQHAREYLHTERPGLVLLAPPCTMFSTLLQLSIHTRYRTEACSDASQYVFEHPWGASSWSEKCVQQLLARNDNYLARVDQCQFGLVSTAGNPARKRSGFLTNNSQIAAALTVTCHRDHTHKVNMGRAPGDPANRSRLAQQKFDCLHLVRLRS